MLRYLRLAFSVFCGYVSLLLVASWVQSYSRVLGETVLVTPTHRYDIDSTDGTLIFLKRARIMTGSAEFKPEYPKTLFSDVTTHKRLGIGRYSDGKFSAIGFSYWLLVLLTIPIAAVPWARWRFSLRTLLIAMTLAALGLGWIVYALRK